MHPWSEPNPAEEAAFSGLVERLAEADGPADEMGVWPADLWRIVDEFGAPRWSLPREFGGVECDRASLLRRYARVADGSMTAAFILSQHDAGVRRLVGAADRAVARRWLGAIADHGAFPTVGISQLTTSRRHGAQAVRAEEFAPGRFRVDGIIPWVTAAPRAEILVAGAAMDDGRQLLIALPTDRRGVTVRPPFALAALQASCTAEVLCERVEVDADDLLAGPVADVMAAGNASGTGGLETSALALGLAGAAIREIEGEGREELAGPVEALGCEWARLRDDLLGTAAGTAGASTSAAIRARANSLVLRSTQAYLTARKGTGFLREEAAQRWARQALFFLVWSCPGPVAGAVIRDLAGVCT
jgi:butyryl-CoA dehydrogenase